MIMITLTNKWMVCHWMNGTMMMMMMMMMNDGGAV